MKPTGFRILESGPPPSGQTINKHQSSGSVCNVFDGNCDNLVSNRVLRCKDIKKFEWAWSDIRQRLVAHHFLHENSLFLESRCRLAATSDENWVWLPSWSNLAAALIARMSRLTTWRIRTALFPSVCGRACGHCYCPGQTSPNNEARDIYILFLSFYCMVPAMIPRNQSLADDMNGVPWWKHEEDSDS